MSLTNYDFDKLVMEDIDRVWMTSRSDDSLLLMFDQIQNGSVSNGVETTYGTGRRGVRLSSLDRNKTATFSCVNGYVIASALAAQVGATIEEAAEDAPIAVPDFKYMKVTDPSQVVLENEVIGEEGAEISYIYKAQSDMSAGVKYSIAAEASAEAFAFNPETKVISLPTGAFVAGDTVIVAYDRKATIGKKITNKSDSFAKAGRLLIDILCHDICDENIKYHAIMEFPNAKIDGNFEMSWGDEPMVHNFGAEAMVDPCSVDSDLWNLYIA